MYFLPDPHEQGSAGISAGQPQELSPPRPGVTIIRDKEYGVPRIYGDTDEDVEFGAGYVAAQDRLFFIDVLRHTGRAQLSSFIGGSPGNRAMDHEQWSIAPYTEADLQLQIDMAGRHLRRARNTARHSPQRVRGRDQRLHRRGDARPEQDAGGVRRVRDGANALERART